MKRRAETENEIAHKEPEPPAKRPKTEPASTPETPEWASGFPPNYYPPKYDPLTDKHFDIDDTQLFLGERRSGKTTQCLEWSLKRRRLYPLVYCFSKTQINNFWHQVLPGPKICGEVDDDTLEQIVRGILTENSKRYAEWKRNKYETGRVTGNPIAKVIFEDYVSAGTLRKLKVLQDMCFNGRHHGIASDILSQDYIGMTPGERDNMDRFILYRPDSGRTRNMIRESFGNEILEIAERVWNNGKALVVCKKKRVPPLERLAWTEGDVEFNKSSVHKHLTLGSARLWGDIDVREQKKKRPYVELPSLATLEAQFNEPIEVEPGTEASEDSGDAGATGGTGETADETLNDMDLPGEAKDLAKDAAEAASKKPTISSSSTGEYKKVKFV